MENTSEKKSMPLLGDAFPEMKVQTTQGIIELPKAFSGKWFVLFSHPAGFTPVCTTEFVAFQKRYDKFKTLNCELIGLSVDQVYAHIKWEGWIKENLSVLTGGFVTKNYRNRIVYFIVQYVNKEAIMPRRDGTGPSGQGKGKRRAQRRGLGRGKGSGRMKGNRPGAGPAGNCVCPKCGAEIPHRVSTPCYSVKCPKCGAAMARAK